MVEPSFTFKILTIGESGVGKTCILRRFVDNKFIKTHLATIGIDFKTKVINVCNKPIKLKIWDTAGQERFRNITNQYYKGADGIILVFDVTDQFSFDKISEWMTQINNNTTKSEIGLVLLGNKIDMEPRVINTQMVNALATQLGIKYFETSALSGTNIEDSIDYLANEIMTKKHMNTEHKETLANKVQIRKEDLDVNQEKKKCCLKS